MTDSLSEALIDEPDHREEEEEEEEECRVCRGPAEEGHPLYKPCKCSGSIGLTHQDCLQSWLQVQRGDGRCELCKTKFRFAPQYHPGAPEKLPVHQVLSGVSRRAVSRWLPFLLRSAFAASLWLVVAPLCTAWLYEGWMHKPASIVERFRLALIPRDLVSGAVVAASVIISFLSLMSFADFLRVEVQRRGLHAGADRHRRRHGPEEPRLDPTEAEIDNEIWVQSQRALVRRQRNERNRVAFILPSLDRELHRPGSDSNDDDDSDDDDFDVSFDVPPHHEEQDESHEDSHNQGSDEASQESWEHESDDEIENNFLFGNEQIGLLPLQPHEIEMERQFLLDGRNNDGANGGIPNRPVNILDDDPLQDRFDVDQDDAVDMDINIALDELLGVRGPLSTVVRNLMWLLAFNAVYIGFFVCTPNLLGLSFISVTGNITDPDSLLPANYTLSDVLNAVESVSVKENTIFRLSDMLSVAVGYLVGALVILFIKSIWILSRRVHFFRRGRVRIGNNHEDDEVRGAIDEINRIMLGGNVNDINHIGEEQGLAVAYAVGLAIDVTTAVVKVGLLLFLKMFMLPTILGICLDASTLQLLRSSIEDRIIYAGRDLFSFCLLHWVAGITFMLLVTVSVLQLREVAHPRLLANMIKPQENSPDLIGNLYHETALTHGKRMLLSLVIYAVLLSLHISVPLRLFMNSPRSATLLPYLEVKLYYFVMPHLQVPIELLFFHLCVLGILEKNKNCIGELQYHWFKTVGKVFGLVESILPRTVAEFRLLGRRPVYKDDDVDPFWYELAKAEKNREKLVAAQIDSFEPYPSRHRDVGETKENGERVLRFSSDFIRLPVRLPGPSVRSRSILLPTKIGRFRLKRATSSNDVVFQIWEEVPGETIPRPPEGWDDLGAGGADVQGRWAWGREKKSNIERGVAFRAPYFDGHGTVIKVFKVALIAVLSWMATTFVICMLVLVPLSIGRFLYFILRVPEHYVHDPFAYAIGSGFFYPRLRTYLRLVVCNEASVFARLKGWLARFRAPPPRKAAILLSTVLLWFGTTPLLIGLIVDIAFLKPASCFSGKFPLFDAMSITLDFFIGSVFLYIWSRLCIAGVMTWGFWANFLQGPQQPADGEPNEADARAAAWQRVGNNRLRLPWQGKHGRAARFREAWTDILNFEWDKVDPNVLLLDFAAPVARKAALILLLPLTCSLLVMLRFPGLSGGEERAILVRFFMFLVVASEAARAWKDHISLWFKAAHDAARDEQYLIGRILLNHED